MDWNLIISRNQALLVRIVAELFGMLRMVGEGGGSGGGPLSVGFADTSPNNWGEVKASEVDPSAELLTSPRLRGEVSAQPTERGLPPKPSTASANTYTLPRHLYNAIMLILIPCESAIRRLIVIAARGLVLKPLASRAFPAGFASLAPEGLPRSPQFQLLDPRKHFGLEAYNNNPEPQFRAIERFDPGLAHRQAQLAAAPVNATHLFTRLRAMRIALHDLPRQARRLARWEARMKAAIAARRARAARTSSRRIYNNPLRPGLPPGYRRKELHQIDTVLKDVHYFALEPMRRDTG